MESVIFRARGWVPPQPGRIVQLDSLRGIAALGVALFHLGAPGSWWMWSFVDLFFVLSGFVITRLLLRSADLNGAVLKAFWVQRILRIWPVYFLTLLVVLAIYVVRNVVGTGLAEPEGILSLFFFLQFADLYFSPLPHPSYFELNAQFLPFLFHSWSLAVEEQFYLLWPLVLILTRRRPAVIVGVALSALALSFAARSFRFSEYLLLTRMDGLFLGACLAAAERGLLSSGLKVDARRSVLGWGFVALGCITTLSLLVSDSPTHAFAINTDPLLVLEFSLLYTAIVGVVVCFPNTNWTAALRWQWLVYLGGISYALYMFHLPVFGVGKLILAKTGIEESVFTDVALLLAVIACAGLSRRLLENPIDRFRRRLAGAVNDEGAVAVRS